jgi:hypothetical protein
VWQLYNGPSSDIGDKTSGRRWQEEQDVDTFFKEHIWLQMKVLGGDLSFQQQHVLNWDPWKQITYGGCGSKRSTTRAFYLMVPSNKKAGHLRSDKMNHYLNLHSLHTSFMAGGVCLCVCDQGLLSTLRSIPLFLVKRTHLVLCVFQTFTSASFNLETLIECL